MQTKKRSLLEVICNTASGLIVAYFVWNLCVIPLAHSCNWNMNDLFWWQVTLFNVIFTVISVIRGYIWRRLFNHYD